MPQEKSNHRHLGAGKSSTLLIKQNLRHKAPSREALIHGLESIIDEYEKDQSMIIEDIKKLLKEG